tara:strand:+ start:4625 stop:5515 length:891 start_codon:yes stop_codon:yes gene_type:complete
MDFLTGYTLKPDEVRDTGEVYFTDGTNNGLMANQVTCEAYGYTYDPDSGSCMAFRYNTNLNRNFRNINNKFNGAGNIAGVGSNFFQINGTNNTGKGGNTNCFINGSNNEIANGVSDATVLGTGGRAKSNGEFVIGGGKNQIGALEGALYADRKATIVNLSGTTTDNSDLKLPINGDTENPTYIGVKFNSVVGFEIYITRLEVEGSSSTPGNYSYKNIKGVVRIDESGTMLFQVGMTRNIGSIGVGGTSAMVDTSTVEAIAAGEPTITVQVSDRNNVTNIWSATVTLHELISTNIDF